MDTQEIEHLRKLLDKLKQDKKDLQAKLKHKENYFQNNFNHLETGTSTPESPTS